MIDRASHFIVAVVDDDPRILQSLGDLLESADYGVRLLASASALLDDSLPEIDCLISDIDMPGVDGFELLRRVQKASPGLPTILITGYPDRLKQLPASSLGTNRFFTKPFQGSVLLAAVGEAISSYRN